jgi:hypothetical protein
MAETAERAEAGQTAETAAETAATGIYVYGIFPGDVELTAEREGVGEPPGVVRVIRCAGLAALVSDVALAQPLGTPADLRTHQEILDDCAAAVTVLPMRFGAVLASDEAVAQELLEPYRDEFATALNRLDGRAQYVIKGRYVEQAILNEILAEDENAAALRDRIRGGNPDATRDARIRLGEIISQSVTAKRDYDTQVLARAMQATGAPGIARGPAHERDAVNVAFLLDAGQEDELYEAVAELERAWRGRVELRVLGPMAAYDFVTAPAPGGSS